MTGAIWSPDGQQIFYNKGSDIYLAKSDGTESRKLGTAPGARFIVDWSPDGSTIRFNAVDPNAGTSILYEVSADGGNLHRLLPGWSKPGENECCGTWTRDGKYFIFSAALEITSGGSQGLWAIVEEPGFLQKPRHNPVPLTAGPNSYIFPLNSLDGKKLFAIGWLGRGELVRYEAKVQQFLPYLGEISASDVDLSRDGQWVAYVSYIDGTLWRSKVDGSERLQLTFLPTLALLPRWSPDGKRIAFMGQPPGKPWKIQLVPAEGGAPQQLIAEEREEADAQWSPDGNQFLFGRWPANPSDTVALHLLDLRTNQVSTVPGSEGLRSPRWSRDGRYVVTTKDQNRKLVLFDFTSHRKVKLAATKGGLQLSQLVA